MFGSLIRGPKLNDTLLFGSVTIYPAKGNTVEEVNGKCAVGRTETHLVSRRREVKLMLTGDV